VTSRCLVRQRSRAICDSRTARFLARPDLAVPIKETIDDLAGIEKAVPAGAARGDRYPAAHLSMLGVGN